ncbi:hypothetical protein [Sporosarcina sp. FSL W7-1283]|uniref:hypothetical protein n=1 Tax=Sporosarcina sp. FSL W7-1283 TaxID=2921560 RepID=UPI0030FB1476
MRKLFALNKTNILKEVNKIARLYKVEMYLTDANGEFRDAEQFKNHLEYVLQRMDATMKLTKLEVSKEFEWEDDLKINLVKATVEDFEEYFKKEE